MTDTTRIAVELEVRSDAHIESILEVVQHRISEIKDFELRGKIPE